MLMPLKPGENEMKATVIEAWLNTLGGQEVLSVSVGNMHSHKLVLAHSLPPVDYLGLNAVKSDIDSAAPGVDLRCTNGGC